MTKEGLHADRMEICDILKQLLQTVMMELHRLICASFLTVPEATLWPHSLPRQVLLYAFIP